MYGVTLRRTAGLFSLVTSSRRRSITQHATQGRGARPRSFFAALLKRSRQALARHLNNIPARVERKTSNTTCAHVRTW